MKLLMFVVFFIIIIITFINLMKIIFKSSKKILILLLATVITSALVILINIYRWSLMNTLTIFFQPLLELGIMGVFFIVCLLNILNFIIEIRKGFNNLKGYRSTLPVAISIVTILIIIYFPFTEITIKRNFKANFKERKQVVSMIETGKLKSNVSYNDRLIQLPNKYSHLSRGGGEVIIEKEKGVTKVLFFTFRGVLDNFSGFIYRSDNKEPSKQEFNGDFKQMEKIEKYWFWGASY